jgi:hypothetical protein
MDLLAESLVERPDALGENLEGYVRSPAVGLSGL